MTLFEQYQRLDLDGSLIGLERGSETGDYFCTPIGMIEKTGLSLCRQDRKSAHSL